MIWSIFGLIRRMEALKRLSCEAGDKLKAMKSLLNSNDTAGRLAFGRHDALRRRSSSSLAPQGSQISTSWRGITYRAWTGTTTQQLGLENATLVDGWPRFLRPFRRS